MEPLSIIHQTVGVPGACEVALSSDPADVLADVIGIYIDKCSDVGAQPLPDIEAHLQVMQRADGEWVWSILCCDDATVSRILGAVHDRLHDVVVRLQLCDSVVGDRAVHMLGLMAKRLTSLSIVRGGSMNGTITRLLVGALAKCTRLHELRLEGNQFTDDDAEALSMLHHVSSLESLTLSGNSIGYRGVAYLTRFLGCQTLKCCGQILGSYNDLQAAWFCRRCQKLMIRSLREAPMAPEEVTCCGDRIGSYCQTSKHFSCAGCMKDWNAATSPVPNAILKSFTLSNNSIGALGAQFFAEAVRYSTGLSSLSVRNTGLLMNQHLVDALNPETKGSSYNARITDVDLSENEITGSVLRLLMQMLHERSYLRKVALGGLRMADPSSGGAQQVGKLVKVLAGGTKLKVVDVSGGILAGADPEDIIKLMCVKGMQRLSLAQNPDVDEGTMQAVAAACLENDAIEEVDVRGTCDEGAAADMWSEVVSCRTTRVLRDMDISGEWWMTAANVPERPDAQYRIPMMKHNMKTGELTGVLHGKTQKFNVSGKVKPQADGGTHVYVVFDWKGGKESYLNLRVIPPPAFSETPRCAHHAATRIHMVGRLINGYASTEGDSSVVVIPSKNLARFDSAFNPKTGFRGIRAIFGDKL
eukprot:TRINITY_DN28034_c0_g1_i1.p1 TRINITY_DN28034_c0_g1~~TRINITY_DN28034_c0_g1_i1.p1  ORF type:complete len:642 (+),score=209.44 TRINITY_DN28034_c0_g1_i1:35-1960(+)